MMAIPIAWKCIPFPACEINDALVISFGDIKELDIPGVNHFAGWVTNPCRESNSIGVSHLPIAPHHKIEVCDIFVGRKP